MSLALRKSSGQTVRVAARPATPRKRINPVDYRDYMLRQQEKERHVDVMSYRELAEYGGAMDDLSADLRAKVLFARQLAAGTERSKVGRASIRTVNEVGMTE